MAENPKNIAAEPDGMSSFLANRYLSMYYPSLKSNENSSDYRPHLFYHVEQ
jgi:hypothetical protein